MLIALLVDDENPTVLKGLLEANAHAVITKPFRSTGVLGTLVLARSVHGYGWTAWGRSTAEQGDGVSVPSWGPGT